MTSEVRIPISALEHHVYCARQCALIHVEGMWVESEHTARGDLGHRRVDSGEHRNERNRLVLRAIPLWSEALGLTGRADAIEVHADGSFVPIEYKTGTRHGDAAHVQLCAQALCLEEMTGRRIARGGVWFTASRRRVLVYLDAELRARTRAVIDEVRMWLSRDQLPPAVNDARCQSCQLVEVCQPRVTARPAQVIAYLEEVFACTF
jgi:CRISPR-associated exonuclease Cas4